MNEQYCQQCGEKLITNCPRCGAPIHGGKYQESGQTDMLSAINSFYDEQASIELYAVPPQLHKKMQDVPLFCYHCGAMHPWTQKAMAALEKGLSGSRGLSIELKRECKNIFADIESTKVPLIKGLKMLANKFRANNISMGEFKISDVVSAVVVNTLSHYLA